MAIILPQPIKDAAQKPTPAVPQNVLDKILAKKTTT